MKHIIIFLITLSLFSCQREKFDFLGGSLNDQFGQLSVIDSLRPNSSTFNFSLITPRYFQAQWSKI